MRLLSAVVKILRFVSLYLKASAHVLSAVFNMSQCALMDPDLSAEH